MSVIVIIKVLGDTATARATFAAQGDLMQKIAARAKEAGALRHKFAAGEGEIVIVDEWTSREAFQGFFGDPEIGLLMAAAGASGPAVEFYDVID